MKKIILLSALLLAFSGVGAQTDLVAKLSKGPYLTAVTEEGFTVVWTSTKNAVAWVEVVPDDGEHFYNTERPRYYQLESGLHPKVGLLHAVRVSGLKPGTSYRYRILTRMVAEHKDALILFGETWGSDVKAPDYKARTLDPQSPEAEFVVVNDIHSNDSIFRLLIRDVKPETTDFVVFNGDMQSNMVGEKQMFDGFLGSACKDFARRVPFYFVRGNHEYRGYFAPAFSDYFPSPSGKTYYSFRHGPAMFIVLDSGEDKADDNVANRGVLDLGPMFDAQKQWLKELVQSPEFTTASKKIVFVHIPINGKTGYGVHRIADRFRDILNGAGIDLMVSGHNHRYTFAEKNTDGFGFPVITNASNQKLRIGVTASQITVQAIDAEGKVAKTHILK